MHSNYDVEAHNEYLGILKTAKDLKAVSGSVEKFIEYLKYAALTVSVKSPYYEYEMKERAQKAFENCTLDKEDLRIPELHKFLAEYKEISEQNRIIKLVNSMYSGIDKLCSYFETVDFTKEIESGAHKGKLVHDPSKLVSAIEKADKLLNSLTNLRKKMLEEMKQDSGNRGGAETGFFG